MRQRARLLSRRPPPGCPCTVEGSAHTTREPCAYPLLNRRRGGRLWLPSLGRRRKLAVAKPAIICPGARATPVLHLSTPPQQGLAQTGSMHRFVCPCISAVQPCHDTRIPSAGGSGSNRWWLDQRSPRRPGHFISWRTPQPGSPKSQTLTPAPLLSRVPAPPVPPAAAASAATTTGAQPTGAVAGGGGGDGGGDGRAIDYRAPAARVFSTNHPRHRLLPPSAHPPAPPPAQPRDCCIPHPPPALC